MLPTNLFYLFDKTCVEYLDFKKMAYVVLNDYKQIGFVNTKTFTEHS